MQELIQGTPEWLEMRRTKIGASDAPVIMKVSPWSTPYELWEEKLGLREREVTSYMLRGLGMEEEARTEFERQTGITVFPDVMFHPKYPWMMASLDGIDIERQNIVELKCPGREDHSLALSGKVPEKYIPQLQHQMAVTGLDLVYYFSYDGNSSKVIEVERSERYQNQMIKAEEKFFECLVNLEAPELSDRDYKIIDNDLWRQVAAEWIDTKRTMESLQEKEEALRRQIIHMSNRGNVKGCGIKVAKTIRRGSIDYRSVPEIQGMDLESYRKRDQEVWKITKG